MAEQLKVYYDADTNLDIIRGFKVAVIGYGSQGHAHAQNLKDSGVDVRVGLYEGSSSRSVAEQDGLPVCSVQEAVAGADWVMLLTPDETQPKIYAEDVEPHIKQGATLSFGHGFNIHYKYIVPRADLNVVMIAPKGPGHTVRSTFKAGAGVPSLVAVHADRDGKALDCAVSYAAALGAGKTGIISTNFRDETETDLFGEQAVLCGGIPALILAGYETLTEAGYAPELAYFECLHETKLIVDLIYEGGLRNMFHSVSNTAEYGGYERGPEIVDANTRQRMKEILKRVQDGSFAKQFRNDCDGGGTQMKKYRQSLADNDVEKTGERLRSMMQAVFGERLVKQRK